MGTALAVLLERAGLDVQLGCRSLAQAERAARSREEEGYLPGVRLDRSVRVCTVADIEFAAVDLVVLAVPCKALPAAVGQIGAAIAERSAVLVVSKGLVPPSARRRRPGCRSACGRARWPGSAAPPTPGRR